MNEIFAAGSIVALIGALTQVVKGLGLSSRYAPLTSIVLGVGLTMFFVGLTKEAALAGLVGGLAASGLYDVTKTTILGK